MGFKYTDPAHKIVAFTYTDEDGEEQWFDGIDKAVLLNLAEHASNETGVSFPGQSLIAAETLFSKKAVKRSIGVLIHIGFITSIPPGERKTTTYTLNLERITGLLTEQNETIPTKKPKRAGNFKKNQPTPVVRLKPKESKTTSFSFEDDDCPVCGEEICDCKKPSATFSFEDEDDELGYTSGTKPVNAKPRGSNVEDCPTCGKSLDQEELDPCQCESPCPHCNKVGFCFCRP